MTDIAQRLPVSVRGSTAVRRLVEVAVALLLGVLVLATTTVLPERTDAPAVVLLALVAAGSLCVFAPRVEIPLAAYAIFVGCVDGPLKLMTGSDSATFVRDGLLLAVTSGVLIRSTIRHERLPRLPYVVPAVLFVVVVLAMGAHPDTPGLKGALAGYRQQLAFAPLLLLAAYIRPDRRFIIGFGAVVAVVVTANAIAAAVQLNLSPKDFAAWGPGYADAILGKGSFEGSGRTFTDLAGESRVRPFGLGGDFGTSGVIAWIAFPIGLAMMISGRGRIRQIGTLSFATAVVAVLAAQARSSVVVAFVAVMAFFALRTRSRNAGTSLVLLGAAALLIFTLTSVFSATTDSSVLDRYRTITPGASLTTAREERGGSIALLAEYAKDYPVGVGLGRSGPGSGAVGDPSGLNTETEFNFLISEIGTLGMVAFLALWLLVLRDAIVLARRRWTDPLENAFWCGCGAVMIAGSIAWFQGAISPAPPVGPVFWFLAGLVGVAARRRDPEPAHGPGRLEAR